MMYVCVHTYVSVFTVILFSLHCCVGPPKEVTCCGHKGVTVNGGIYLATHRKDTKYAFTVDLRIGVQKWKMENSVT